MKKNKAQMEIMGLVIIIILISLAILFVLQFVILKEPSDTKKTYMQTQLAANTLNAMLKTTTNCKSQDITQLLQDCASYQPNGLIDCGNGQRSCAFAEQAIKQILGKSLDSWKKEYYLTADLANKRFGTPCPGEKQSRLYPIPTEAGVMTVRLDVCG